MKTIAFVIFLFVVSLVNPLVFSEHSIFSLSDVASKMQGWAASTGIHLSAISEKQSPLLTKPVIQTITVFVEEGSLDGTSLTFVDPTVKVSTYIESGVLCESITLTYKFIDQLKIESNRDYVNEEYKYTVTYNENSKLILVKLLHLERHKAKITKETRGIPEGWLENYQDVEIISISTDGRSKLK